MNELINPISILNAAGRLITSQAEDIKKLQSELEAANLRISELEKLNTLDSEQLVTFTKWVGYGYTFENNAEQIVKDYLAEKRSRVLQELKGPFTWNAPKQTL